MLLKLNYVKNYKFYSLIILIILISKGFPISIKLKKIKTTFQKKTSNKISSSDSDITIENKSGKINNLDNYLFAADVKIGSDKQSFTIILDTGSELLWVPGVDDSSTGAKIYHPSTSTTSP